MSALDWLERERPNLLAAQRRAADTGWSDLAWQLCEAMWGLFLYRKHFEQWIGAHELAIEAAGRCGNAAAKAVLTVRLGIAYLNLQRYDTAHDRFSAALEVSQTAGDPRTEATALEHLGLAARRTGHPDEAMDHFTAALAITERLGEHRGTALHLRRIGETYPRRAATMRRLPYLRRAVAAATDVGDAVLALERSPGSAPSSPGSMTSTAARETLREAVDMLAGSGSDHYHADAVLALATWTSAPVTRSPRDSTSSRHSTSTAVLACRGHGRCRRDSTHSTAHPTQATGTPRAQATTQASATTSAPTVRTAMATCPGPDRPRPPGTRVTPP